MTQDPVAALLEANRELHRKLSRSYAELVDDEITRLKREVEIQRGIITEMLTGKARSK